MNILETIVENKRKEVDAKKVTRSIDQLRRSEFYKTETRSLRQFLLNPDKTGIIAEFKRKSPSKGWFNKTNSPEDIITSYDQFGASGISILTDTDFFGGSLADLEEGRRTVQCPILRKDFLIDIYQIEEAKASGADVILLIAAILTPIEVKEFAQYAKKLKLEVLLEIHNEEELKHICEDVDFVGVNNRDLKTFLVDIKESLRLSKSIPDRYLKISESGIDNINTIKLLKDQGFSGFLLGEKFMKEKEPGKAFREFVNELKGSNEN